MKQTSIFIAFFVLTVSYTAQALQQSQQSYYGSEFYSSILNQAKDEKLKLGLKKILKSGHIRAPGRPDQLVESCDSIKNCSSQNSIGYSNARKFLFGKFYLVKVDSGNYGIKEFYCDRVYQNSDFGSGQRPGPGLVPDNNVINVEHTWPQSKFTGKYSKEMQKSDLHHLYPTDSQMNSIRGNHMFGEVERDGQHTKCSASRTGQGSAGGATIFEPPNNHKGHVARAIFYFSVRYDIPIAPAEEVILKTWAEQFPVDAEESLRNDEIYKIQGNRNPFVDHPELVKSITDF
ncbi:MAG: hypothetical protein A2622_10055 [Bdellovibrionales bacterium RIFCSPHIGHO2_01_FULL_40_29]|nr:MAG: hypothetical protein A2622_10055 [Bdellovibrionales bacterium RIFCSPHIGHO2_01_FULL_40_29]OFZ32410.1 MAG: hypothetical protein A3D17_12605 [Bdellovibrionales bacterium RIFCSPHIGHO2_02_FULL_40_15]